MQKTKQSDRNVSLSVGMATQVVTLLKKAATNESLTTRLRSKLSRAAAEMEVCIRLKRDSQISVPKRLVETALRGMVYLVRFRKEILELANSLIGNSNK